MKPYRLLIVSVILFFLLLCFPSQKYPRIQPYFSIPSLTPSPIIFHQVIAIIDGDTIDVDIEGKKERVRLIGIDAPELGDSRKPIECFAREASEKMKDVVGGKKISLQSDPTQSDRDIYGRLLRYVFLEDGTFVNKLMIEEGFSHEYTYGSNPYEHQREFQEAETKAREERLGLWAEGACR